ncbi:hypothetical protein AMATHDRAFT_47764 [Amanita thiersii Skay4041]|uniref:Uncharacterized protein n=1 Tax=Amanita thiersii Skay4041 TaxID=703135 RepID=A0A2A9NQE6_9AGAR|nr:hypothetical protein AMATHDRAFT_47764 [Amanita thiersii Skay4041]
MSSDIQNALEVNKVYQEALIQHAEQMETQLTEVDSLLSEVGTYDETDNANLVPVYVEGAIRFKAPVPSSLLLKPDSPFYAEATQRTRYCYNSSPHPMRSRELRTLSDAVKQENQRSNVLGLPSPLDWEKVAKQVNIYSILVMVIFDLNALKVSLCSNAKHSAEEYRIKWLGEERVVSNSNKTIEPTSFHQRRVLPEGFDTRLTEAVQIYGLDNWSLGK